MVPQLTLASNSPRRRQILALTGWPFTIRPVEIDEQPLPGEPPADYVLRLASGKARAAAKQAGPGEIILTADTTVADRSLILGKPASPDEARQMLRSLRGREHTVYTAVGVLGVMGEPAKTTARLVTDLCAARVWMRDYSDQEIEDYIASGDPFDKAGAYAIQHPGFQPVERIEGCYACVVGLPLCHLARALTAFNLQPPANIGATCPENLKIDTPCPALETMLRNTPGEGPASRP